MKLPATLTASLLASALMANAVAADAPPQAPAQRIDAMVKMLAVGQTRVFGKSAAFCTASHLPAGKSVDASYKSFSDAFIAGTRAGLTEIAKTDKSVLAPGPVYGPKDLEMMDKQADAMLAHIKASPEESCTKLVAVLDSGSADTFKRVAIQGHQEYVHKRAEYCARSPKPAGCD